MENNQPHYVAIDPGATGSASFFQGPAYVTSIAFGGGLSDMKALHLMCNQLRPSYAFVEHVRSMPRDGRKQAFSFGRRRAEVESTLYLSAVDMRLVNLHDWPKKLGLPKRYEVRADAARRRTRREDQEKLAIALYPHLENHPGDIWASVLIGYSQLMNLYPELKGILAAKRKELGWK